MEKINLSRNEYIDIKEAIRLGLTRLVYQTEDGILAYSNQWKLYFLCVNDNAIDEFVGKIDEEKLSEICVHNDKAAKLIAEKFDLGGLDTVYCQFVNWNKLEYIQNHITGELEIRHPDESDFPTVLSYYDVVPENVLWEDFHNPSFIGGYVDGKMAAFIGLHREGAMGLLRVFPEYRRRGFAEKIYSYLIASQIQKGNVPFCHVVSDNDASIALQEKLGFERANMKISWLFRD